jgi:cell division protein FtsW (lipid II flippase)
MFDTINGLPVHALVLHATVVLLPLMALVTVLVAFRDRLRRQYAGWVALVDLLLVGLVLVTKLSGEKLQKRLGGNVAVEHGRLGDQLVWFAVGLFVASVVVVVTRQRSGVARIGAQVLSVVAAVALVVWTVRVGDSGAREVWGGAGG